MVITAIDGNNSNICQRIEFNAAGSQTWVSKISMQYARLNFQKMWP